MEIKKVKNKYGKTVYHVKDEGCIQEFWTRKEAQEYIDHCNQEFWTRKETQKYIDYIKSIGE